MTDLNDIEKLINSGNVNDALINELYDEIIELDTVFLSVSPSSCGAPAYCGKSPNSCYQRPNGACDCKC